MALVIKRARHTVGDDLVYADNDTVSTKVLDNNMNIIGTLDEYLISGKTIENVPYTSIKRTGLYNVRNLSGLPSDISTSSNALLEVRAIGDQNNPTLVTYKLTTNDGRSHDLTSANGKSTGWTLGGVELQNTINTLNAQVGNLTQLSTTSKNNLVNAVNEVRSKADRAQGDANNLEVALNNYKKHNHDDRYVLKQGGTYTGNVTFDNKSSLNGTLQNGTVGHLIGTVNDNSDTNLSIGNGAMNLQLHSKGAATLNGSEILTKGNTGSGSGLNADMLDGLDSSKFARKDADNTFTGDVVIHKRSALKIYNDSDWTRLGWFRASDNKEIGHIDKSDDGMTFSANGNGNQIGLWGDQLWSNVNIAQNAGNGETTHSFHGEGGENLGFYYNNGRGELGIYDWARGNCPIVFTRGHNGVVEIGNLMLNNRRVFLQNEQPGGNIPYGSIWIGF